MVAKASKWDSSTIVEMVKDGLVLYSWDCPGCLEGGAWYKDQFFAKQGLDRHRTTRGHRTNNRAPYRGKA